jgi:hypothetical protein
MVVCRSISVFWCYYSYNLHFGRIAASLLTGLEGFDNCGTVSGVLFSQSCFFVVIYVILRVSTGVFKNFDFFLLQINSFLVFFDRFDVLMSKINLKK